MDAFERVVASLLEHDGHWVRPSYKVMLTREEKQAIGRPSSPRWEIDLLAYKGITNSVLVVECKSYLDSRGVGKTAFDGSTLKFANRFKLFTDHDLRETILARLAGDLVVSGYCAPNPSIRLCLAAGHIASEADRSWLRRHFAERNWLLWDEDWMSQRLEQLAGGSFENDVAAVVAKLIIRRLKQ